MSLNLPQDQYTLQNQQRTLQNQQGGMQNQQYLLVMPQNQQYSQTISQGQQYSLTMPQGQYMAQANMQGAVNTNTTARQPMSPDEALLKYKIQRAQGITSTAGDSFVNSKAIDDDGKISGSRKFNNFMTGIGKGAVNMLKGMLSVKGLLGMAGMTILSLAAPAAGVVALGGLSAFGVITGISSIASAADKASQATTDDEAAKAWQDIGAGTFTTGVSALTFAKCVHKLGTTHVDDATGRFKSNKSKQGKSKTDFKLENVRENIANALKAAKNKASAKWKSFRTRPEGENGNAQETLTQTPGVRVRVRVRKSKSENGTSSNTPPEAEVKAEVKAEEPKSQDTPPKPPVGNGANDSSTTAGVEADATQVLTEADNNPTYAPGDLAKIFYNDVEGFYRPFS